MRPSAVFIGNPREILLSNYSRRMFSREMLTASTGRSPFNLESVVSAQFERVITCRGDWRPTTIVSR